MMKFNLIELSFYFVLFCAALYVFHIQVSKYSDKTMDYLEGVIERNFDKFRPIKDNFLISLTPYNDLSCVYKYELKKSSVRKYFYTGDKKAKCNCKYVLSDKYAGSICTIDCHNGVQSIMAGSNDSPPLEEARANAHLIAAAPDLLEAAEEAFNILSWISIEASIPINLDKLKQAIAKAKGE